MIAVVTTTGSNTFFGRTAQLVASQGTISHFQKAVMKIGNFLNGSDQKISTFVDWGWTLLTGQRGKRIILGDEDTEAANTGPNQG
jgi:magnesium-transporting ATPase (P-type)